MGFDWITIIIVLAVVLVSMTLHEAMHGFVAYWLGDDTARLQGRLSFNPLKHIDPFLTVLLPVMLAVAGLPIFGGAKPVPYNPHNVRGGEWGAALIAIAGPLTNLLLAFLSFGLWALVDLHAGTVVTEILTAAVSVNLGFFIFNIIPLPPLDGSRVLYALAPEFIRRGMERFERYGLLVVLILVLVTGSLFSSFMAQAIQFFVAVFGHIFSLRVI